MTNMQLSPRRLPYTKQRGACSLQVVPALDPSTPVYGGPFTMQLVRRRMQEFSMFDEKRFHNIKMGQRFQAGPFE